jgi:serine/threonine-protein kinase RsbW
MNDVTKIVKLEYSVKDKELVFVVSDEGKGFIIEDVPDPTLPENLENIKGRGLFLIKHLSDLVVFENNGSRIKIIFNI